MAEMHAVKSIWQEEDAYLIFLHDVTEVKEGEKRLKANEARYRSFIELTDQLAWVTNANGEVEEDIPSWRRFTGQGADEIKGSGWSKAVHPDDMGHAMDVWRRAAETKSAFGAEYRVRRHDGAYRHFMVRGVPVLNENGNIVEWIKTCIDISERKKVEEETKNSAEIKTKFTSIISHELRTPLTAIKEGISIVLDGSTGGINDEQKDFLDTAKRNVDRLTRLINDVLDFQKMEAGRARLNLQINDIDEVIGYVENTMKPLAAKKGLEIFVETEDSLPDIQCDKDKIIQVLMNLINNALKFTEKGNITITAKRIDGSIDFAVKDTGPGIKNQDLPRLFKPFEQLETTRDKRAGGSGLGLSICKEIIDMHRGKIYAESEFGKGSTFHFLLPIQVEQRQVV